MTIIEDLPSDHQYRAWVKVRLENPPNGCAKEGWVHREYLKLAGNALDSLPREAAIYDDSPEAAIPEGCDGTCAKTIQDLKDVASGVVSLSNISSWKIRARGLVQIPLKGSGRHRPGPCGSFHPNVDRENGKVIDNYASPLTACVMMAFMQEWKKRQDAKGGADYVNKGARLQWGDMSHPTAPYYEGHKEHTEGNCVDIRPMRDEATGFVNSGIQHGWAGYSRSSTREMIELAREMGSNRVIFNDPQLIKEGLSTKLSQHDNHLHVCFPNTSKTRGTCENYQYDPGICGGLN
jgi:hypothetical protein